MGDPEMEKQMVISEKINQQFNKLVDYWGGKYPDYYGGAYIENERMVLLVTCDPAEVNSDIARITGNDDIEYKKVDNSYAELEALRIRLNDIIHTSIKENENKNIYKIASLRVDRKNNDVLVMLMPDAPDKGDYLEKIFGKDSRIRYEYQKNPIVQQSTNIMAGCGQDLVNASNNKNGTISFNAKMPNAYGVTKNGFVISGHVTSNYGDQIKINGTTVGTVIFRSLGGYYDAAFVDTSGYPGSGYVNSNILSTYYSIVGPATTGMPGTIYAMHGGVSGIVYGTVVDDKVGYWNNEYDFSSSYWMEDQICMRLSTERGDSGAPLVSNGYSYTRYVVGILNGGDGFYSYYSKASRILSGMNGWLY
ncbi:MAG: S1 family peptidase [Lachnospiraceae bacterium]|nr:S1 family peptidase [Lachnospiraceae bacterium]